MHNGTNCVHSNRHFECGIGFSLLRGLRVRKYVVPLSHRLESLTVVESLEHTHLEDFALRVDANCTVLRQDNRGIRDSTCYTCGQRADNERVDKVLNAQSLKTCFSELSAKCAVDKAIGHILQSLFKTLFEHIFGATSEHGADCFKARLTRRGNSLRRRFRYVLHADAHKFIKAAEAHNGAESIFDSQLSTSLDSRVRNNDTCVQVFVRLTVHCCSVDRVAYVAREDTCIEDTLLYAFGNFNGICSFAKDTRRDNHRRKHIAYGLGTSRPPTTPSGIAHANTGSVIYLFEERVAAAPRVTLVISVFRVYDRSVATLPFERALLIELRDFVKELTVVVAECPKETITNVLVIRPVGHHVEHAFTDIVNVLKEVEGTSAYVVPERLPISAGFNKEVRVLFVFFDLLGVVAFERTVKYLKGPFLVGIFAEDITGAFVLTLFLCRVVQVGNCQRQHIPVVVMLHVRVPFVKSVDGLILRSVL